MTEKKLSSVFRKIIFFLAVSMPCMIAFQTAIAAASFPDVPENTVNFGAVEYLKSKGIISGYPDNTFKPEKTINRAEALKIVMLAAGKIQADSQTQPQTTQQTEQALPIFPDVKTSDWFNSYVTNAWDKEIVGGYPDGTFKPGNNINVAESLKIIEIAFKAELGSIVTENPYPDVDKTVWYAPYAKYAQKKQIIWTFDDGKLHAGRDITRGEFAQIIYRLVYIADKKLEVFPLDTDWPTYLSPSEHYSVKYPLDWQKIQAGTQTILWKQDKENKQVSFARIFPNSATAVIALDKNPEQIGLDLYLARIEYGPDASIKKQTLNNLTSASISLKKDGIMDYYFEFPGKQILIIYSQVGDGLNRTQLSEQIRYLAGSIRYVESEAKTETVSNEQILTGARKNILIAGKGQETLNIFKDIVLVDTDSIGIGTGPIDYYYSASFNVTFKYERKSDVILAIQETKTTAF